jgi:hypothetical protein
MYRQMMWHKLLIGLLTAIRGTSEATTLWTVRRMSTRETNIRMEMFLLRHTVVVLGGLVVACLLLDPKFACSNLAEKDGFLRTTEILNTAYFRGM